MLGLRNAPCRETKGNFTSSVKRISAVLIQMVPDGNEICLTETYFILVVASVRHFVYYLVLRKWRKTPAIHMNALGRLILILIITSGKR
jgi:hypothetical protein